MEFYVNSGSMFQVDVFAQSTGVTLTSSFSHSENTHPDAGVTTVVNVGTVAYTPNMVISL